MSRTDMDAATLARSLRRMAGDGGMEWCCEPIRASVLLDVADLLDENAKLREELDFCLKHAPNCDGCAAMLDCYECLRADSSQKERKRLDYENEKLRELVRELLTDPDSWDYDYFKYRMRELGVEV